jgi:hypothetical protein
MSKINYSKTSGRIEYVIFAILAIMCVVTIATQPAGALSCGDIITADVTLTADVGPCPGSAVSMDGIPAHVTIDLNGHKIIGRGTGTAITIGAAFPGVTVKGPGQIINFAGGILGGGAATDLMVYDVTFLGVGNAIGVGGAGTARIRILNNTIKGNGRGGTAISVADEGGVYIYQNVITGFSTAAVSILGETTVTIDGNYIAHNQAGVVAESFETCTVIRGNNVILNRGIGIQMGFGPAAKQIQPMVATSTCSDIEDNRVTSNGGDGIFVASGEFAPIVQDNIVASNSGNGISIVGAAGGGPMQVVGNRVSNSIGTDLFWDGNGTACWSQNISGTSSPATLPPC